MEKFSTFLSHFRTVRFNKGDMIFVQGEVPKAAYILKKGIVKTYNITADGEEKVISLVGKNEIFPAPWVFSRTDNSLYYHQAFTTCETVVMPRDQCMHFLHQNPDVMQWLCSQLIGLHTSFMLRINALAQSKASVKVVYLLQALCLQFGRDVRKDVVKIELPLTQQDIANLLGIKRETTALQLKKLKDNGVISYARKGYLVKTDQLSNLLNDEYNPGIQI
ncbi:MAG TPA: Crp/Fnr family transcriptional regulator [Candidatus Saccharimonadales bacterium]|nr:Crp/Fnr family transcriptional regulator [Candidatus Saccharimonadales bacterium]